MMTTMTEDENAVQSEAAQNTAAELMSESTATSTVLAPASITSYRDCEIPIDVEHSDIPQSDYVDNELSASAAVYDPMEPSPDYLEDSVASPLMHVFATEPSPDYDTPSSEQRQTEYQSQTVDAGVLKVPDPDYDNSDIVQQTVVAIEPSHVRVLEEPNPDYDSLSIDQMQIPYHRYS
jgi:hypothetical protein